MSCRTASPNEPQRTFAMHFKDLDSSRPRRNPCANLPSGMDFRASRALARGWLGVVLTGLVMGGCSRTQVVTSNLDLPPGEPAQGRVAFTELGCVRCHRVLGDDALPAPVSPVPFVLGEGMASRPTDARLVTDIVNPNHALKEPENPSLQDPDGGSRMLDLTEQMQVRQLIDIVAYLREALEKS